MYPNTHPKVCLKCSSSFCSKKLLERHIRSTGHFVSSERKLPGRHNNNNNKPLARTARNTHKRSPLVTNPFAGPPARIDIEVEEGEITPQEEKEESGRREIEIRKDKERKEREQEAREWESANHMREEEAARKKEERAVGLNARRYSNGMGSQVERSMITRARRDSAVVLDYKVLEIEQRGSVPVGIGIGLVPACPPATVALPLPSLSVTVVCTKYKNCRNRVWGCRGDNAEHLNSISVYHQRRHIPIDHERSRSPLQNVHVHPKISHQRSQVQKNKLSMKSKFHDIKSTSKDACRLEVQTEHVEDRSVGEDQMYTPIGPLIVSNEFLDDRDDVGEWRAEMHGIQDYHFS